MSTHDKLIDQALDRLASYSTTEAAERIGVSHATIARWRRGDWTRLNAETERRVRSFLESEDQKERLEGVGLDIAWSSPGVPDETAVRLISESEFLRALVRSVGEPGDQVSRKGDLVDRYRELLAIVGAVPEWWYDVKSEVKNGAL